ncbi:MAG: hypothetical protein IT355_15550 [Gemmatimonadaceae bacterium]|nr:hypothetical protein [Gemmatimonadaceae bacterium]
MRRSRWLGLTFTALLAFGCGTDTTAPGDGNTNTEPVPQSQLTFLRPAPGVALSRDSAVFWAKRGEDREVAMYYLPTPGSSDSVRYLRFRVRKEALLTRPDGSAFAEGDSVRITIRIRDFSNLITEFSPSGLKFSASKPAELRLDFRNADPDRNRDGVVNAADTSLVASFAIWKQEAVSQPWYKLTSAVEVSSNFSEVKADITSFTNHAVAW